MVEETKWLRWLRSVTHEDTLRGIATAAGVSHTTVRKWVVNGVPADRAWSLALQFHADPIELLVLLGYLEPDRVPDVNYAAVAEYMPLWVLANEIARRAAIAREQYPHIKIQKRRVE